MKVYEVNKYVYGEWKDRNFGVTVIPNEITASKGVLN
jgi:hypothetical protein